MNTITRTANIYNVHPRQKTLLQLMTHHFTLIIVMIAILFSALGIVYVRDLNRRLFIQYQSMQKEKNQQLIDRGKLLLEQSTWSTQSRIQKIAEKELNMHMPHEKEVLLVNELGDSHR